MEDFDILVQNLFVTFQGNAHSNLINKQKIS